jgi:cytoskeletal protein RodZ
LLSSHLRGAVRRAKTMKKRPIHYLLSADQRFRRLSLKRMTARGKTAKSSPRSTRSQKARRSSTPAVSPVATLTVIVVAAMVVVAAAGLPAVRQAFQTTQPENVATASAPAAANPQTAATAPTRSSETSSAVPPTTPPAAIVKTDAPAAIVAMKVAADPSLPIKATLDGASRNRPEAGAAMARDANTGSKELPAQPLGMNSTPVVTSGIEKSEPATVTGCLEASEGGFRLKDASGIDALKSRSWRSGFLKKHAPTIEMIDAASTLQLPSHVGQRVSVTGTLADHTLRAGTLHTLSPSCR